MSNQPRIKSMTLRNFKGIGDEPQTIEFKPITLLFGANSAGKSTVMQALLYFKEVLNGNVDPKFTMMGGMPVNLGGFKRLAHRDEHGQKFFKDIEISVSIELPIGLQGCSADFLSEQELYILSENKMFKQIKDKLDMVSDVSIKIRVGAVGPVALFGIGLRCVEIHSLNKLLIKIESGFDDIYQSAVTYIDSDYSDLLGGCVSSIDQVRFLYKNSYHGYHDGHKSSLIELIKSDRLASQMDNPILGTLLYNLRLSDPDGYRKFLDKKGKNTKKMLSGDRDYFNDLLERDRKINEIVSISDEGGISIENIFEWARLQFGDAVVGWHIDGLYSLKLKPDSRLLIKGVYVDLKNKKNSKAHRENIISNSLCLSFMISSMVLGASNILRDLLGAFSCVGPVRVIPDVSYDQSVEYGTSWSDGSAAWNVMHKKSKEMSGGDFFKAVNYWAGKSGLATGYQVHPVLVEKVDYVSYLSKEMGLSKKQVDKMISGFYGFNVFKEKDRVSQGSDRRLGVYGDDSRVCLFEEATGIDVELNEIGSGISQVFPVIVAALSHENGIFGIEQPELHLHPRLQCELGDLFIKNMGENKAWLLETHSEHLILRLLRRIRETTDGELPDESFALKPEDLAVICVEPGAEGNGTQIKTIRVTPDGDFADRWPGGFFAEREKELF